MKKLLICLIAYTAMNLNCHNGSSTYTGSDTTNTTARDTSHSHQLLPQPSSNSDATNPSIPDTIMTNDSPARRKVVY